MLLMTIMRCNILPKAAHNKCIQNITLNIIYIQVDVRRRLLIRRCYDEMTTAEFMQTSGKEKKYPCKC